jgi:glycosyltransferase involved in cell wall biosynthesis
MKKPLVLLVQDYFLPGFKGGGTLRSAVNIVDRLGDEFRFAVLTRDRDLTDRAPYDNLKPGWNERGNCQVLYLSPSQITPWGIERAVRGVDYDLLYLNSFLSTLTVFLLLLRRLRRLPPRPVVLAPNGELGAGALSIKAGKKAAYIGLVRRLALLRGAIWRASTASEQEEIGRHFDGPIEIAEELPTRPSAAAPAPTLPVKSPGTARFVFLSRISRKKNLARAIELVGSLDGDVVFDIYGPLEDAEYWQECLALMDSLPANVRCAFRGQIPHDAVEPTLSGYHFFLLPTLHENFGHVILEAMTVGLPPIVSDETPWVGLQEKGAGFDLPLADLDGFRNCLRRCVDMTHKEHRRMSERATAHAATITSDTTRVDHARLLFRRALGQT